MAEDARTGRSQAPAECEHGAGWHEGAEPSAASAPAAARAWLLIEHPGPWPVRPAEAAFPRLLEPAVAAAARLGVRVQLIRSPAGTGPEPGRAPGERAGRAPDETPAARPVSVYLCSSTGPRPWLTRHRIAGRHDVARLDLASLTPGSPRPPGTPVAGPLILVCGHGHRNTCCGRFGAPLAAALTRRHGGAVWETTHLGGDRFAANLVILPHGLYYGPVDARSAQAAIDAYRRGEIVLDRFRGRAGRPPAVQAAEHSFMQRTGTRGIDATAASQPPE